MSTVMVIAMAFLAAVMFLLADQVISWLIQLVLGLGGGSS